MFLKPLRGLGFNSQKCGNTFVNWYSLKVLRSSTFNETLGFGLSALRCKTHKTIKARVASLYSLNRG